MKQFKQDEAQNSNKLHLDKYYTSDETAQYCIDVARKVLKGERVSEVIEPSAGNGVFSKKINNCLAYDIEPEDKSIIEQDFLELDIPYKKGRLFIGNPPFGTRNTLSVRFFKKSVLLGDYIAFVLPISQYNNNSQMYDFDLIHSEDLGLKDYSDRSLHCCFNIYKRPKNGLNSKPNFKLKDVTIVEYRRGGNESGVKDGYAFSMGTFGAGCVGKKNNKIGQYALECYFYIHNEKIQKDIVNLLENTDWKTMCKGIGGTYRLPQWKIYKYLRENIAEIQ